MLLERTHSGDITREEIKKDTKSGQALDVSVTIVEFVAEDYRTTKVFEKYGIDFCCGGKVALSEICREKGIDPATIQQELEERLLRSPEARLVTDDWYFVRLSDKRHLVFGSEKNCYVEGDISKIWKEFQPVYERLEGEHLLGRNDERIELTRSGLLQADGLLSEFFEPELRPLRYA